MVTTSALPSPMSNFETLTIDLNSDRSIDAVMSKIKELVMTSDPDSDYATYRFRLKSGAFANIVVQPVLFGSVTVQGVCETNRYMSSSGTLTKSAADKLTKFLSRVAYLMTVTPATRNVGLLPLRRNMMGDGSYVHTISTVNRADVGTPAHKARRGMMLNAADCARRHVPSALSTSDLSRASDGRLFVVWTHAYPTSPAQGPVLSVVPVAPVAPSDDETDEPPRGKRRLEPESRSEAEVAMSRLEPEVAEAPEAVQVVEDRPAPDESA